MKRQQPWRGSGRTGSVAVSAVILTALASILAGSIIFALLNERRIVDASLNNERALYLADAGLKAASVKMNSSGDATISYDQSRNYFWASNLFTKSDWGFTTSSSTTSNGDRAVVATGRYGGKTATVTGTLSLGAGQRTIHAMYAHALYAGNSSGNTNYSLAIGGTSPNADFVVGDVYSGGKIAVSGNAHLRLPEFLNDSNHDGIAELNETWSEAYVLGVYSNPVTQTAYNSYTNSMAAHASELYNNGKYDVGEPFVDTIGNGYYDVGEPFTDSNGNGVRDPGDPFTDLNGNHVHDAGEPFVDSGNGQYDAGEAWTEDSVHKDTSGKTVRVNGKWDAAGGYWKKSGSKYTWTTASYTASWPAEAFEDLPDGVYQPGEPFTDQNGVYDEGEQYYDDRNGYYDYGTEAKGSITGMPSPTTGQRAATGNDTPVDPPDLTHMYYGTSNSSTMPSDALGGWGNDVRVEASDYGTKIALKSTSVPEHIFLRNPGIGSSGSTSSDGATVYKRVYGKTTNTTFTATKDDYFLEDPQDTSFNSPVTKDEIDGTDATAPMYIKVNPSDNNKTYYVDGNLWIHSPEGKSFRFRNPGTRITIVANGNITISDEFYYNATYPSGLSGGQLNSTMVGNPKDELCLIALIDSNYPDSGNIYLGDAQFGTGGAIHAMLYAQNNFKDNNLGTTGQPTLSIFGNMTAGNQIVLNRGSPRTRLDITLDRRIREGTLLAPGLPHPVGTQRSIVVSTSWNVVPGSWTSNSRLRL